MSLSARIGLASKQKITEMAEKEKLDVEVQTAGLEYFVRQFQILSKG